MNGEGRGQRGGFWKNVFHEPLLYLLSMGNRVGGSGLNGVNRAARSA